METHSSPAAASAHLVAPSASTRSTAGQVEALSGKPSPIGAELPSQDGSERSTGEASAPNFPTRPAWMRQPGEDWRDWDRRRLAEIEVEAERKLAQPPMPLDPLYSGSIEMAVGVGTFDCNGNAKGSGWW